MPAQYEELQKLNVVGQASTPWWERRKKFLVGIVSVVVILGVSLTLFGNSGGRTYGVSTGAVLKEEGGNLQCYKCIGEEGSNCGPEVDPSLPLTECKPGVTTCETTKNVEGGKTIYKRKCTHSPADPLDKCGGPYQIGPLETTMCLCSGEDGCNRGAI